MTPRHTKEEKIESFGRFLDILDELRLKCPWDRKQTNESLRTNTIEETYELCEAITNNDPASIKKELGDVLLHVAFYAKIGEEKGLYDMADVCDALCEKLTGDDQHHAKERDAQCDERHAPFGHEHHNKAADKLRRGADDGRQAVGKSLLER